MLKNLELAGDTANHELLLRQYQYDGMDTCAVDGLCATACPVDINTGDLVKRLRRENHSVWANKSALLVAQHFKALQWLARTAVKTGVTLNQIFGKDTMLRLTRGLKKVIPATPLWSNQLLPPPELSVLKATGGSGDLNFRSKVVYFPSCISRMLGSYAGKEKNILETFMSICSKSNIDVVVLNDVNGACCSQVFSSKGLTDAYRFTANKIINQLWQASGEGSLPVVIDVSSCAYTLHQLRPVLEEENKKKLDRLTILDSVDFLHDIVMPFAEVKTKEKNIVLHAVCSLQKMKTEDKLLRVANYFARKVTLPRNSGCCGMAGDRGFLFPELTASATLDETLEVNQAKYDGYYASTKTCEIALSEAVKQNYESILYLVDETVRESTTA